MTFTKEEFNAIVEACNRGGLINEMPTLFANMKVVSDLATYGEVDEDTAHAVADGFGLDIEEAD